MKIKEKINFLYQSFKNITGKNRYSYLIKYIKEYKCKNIIEVGVWNGKNSKKMLNAATLNQQSKDEINYWGFDLWEEMDDSIYQKEYSKKPPQMHDVRRNLDSTGCNINLIRGDTKITLKNFYNKNKNKINIDFIYIDGGHSFDTIQSDWENLNGFIGKNTLTIFDDYYIYTSPDSSVGVDNNLEPTFGCSKLIDSLDRNIWEVKLLPNYDQFGPRKIYFALVVKK